MSSCTCLSILFHACNIHGQLIIQQAIIVSGVFWVSIENLADESNEAGISEMSFKY